VWDGVASTSFKPAKVLRRYCDCSMLHTAAGYALLVSFRRTKAAARLKANAFVAQSPE